MDKEKIEKAFNKFVDDKYAESEDILRQQIRTAVNDHLKAKLELQNDPILDSSDNDEPGDGDSE